MAKKDAQGFERIWAALLSLNYRLGRLECQACVHRYAPLSILIAKDSGEELVLEFSRRCERCGHEDKGHFNIGK